MTGLASTASGLTTNGACVSCGLTQALMMWKLLTITDDRHGDQMIKNGMRPIHRGEVLREDFLVPLGMTPHALSKALHVTPAPINAIVNEKRGVSPETALRLARYLGGDPVSWMNLQTADDLKMVENAKAKTINREIVAMQTTNKQWSALGA